MQKFLTIHGHFYQPPRENAWTETIEKQDSAHPFHDWNERINAECYTPNAFSRTKDAAGRIANIVNNYASISFNFGPTLLSWLELRAPITYQRLIDADRESLKRFDGHGAAIAQAYNHVIMPLANARDKVTQALWGLADFRRRFQREPESMWMPETAVNAGTLRVLIDFGLKYVILSPYQAQSVRLLSSAEASGWVSVEHGDIDSSMPYRWFDRDAQGKRIAERSIDIFFYHGVLSRGVGFEHLLHDAGVFAERVDEAFSGHNGRPVQLVSIATDGETYGHHERFGDMGLAYLLHVEAPRRGIEVTNYGAYLAQHPPAMEVEIKNGPNGEGTAWSCAHGVGRWARNCGCNSGGGTDWNQEWRAPLRAALDNLRDELARLTMQYGERIFNDVWAARNDYIEVILDRSSESLGRFLDKHMKGERAREQQLTAIQLMEIQRQAQLMYTSCGWFFSELSGIETLQIIQYAARAIELAEAVGRRSLEGDFLDDLRLARSNIRDHKNGEEIYCKFVKPAAVSFARIVNEYAIAGLFEKTPERVRVYQHVVERVESQTATRGNENLEVGLVKIASQITTEEQMIPFALTHRGRGEWVRTLVGGAESVEAYAKSKPALLDQFAQQGSAEFFENCRRAWNAEVFTMADMFFERRQSVIDLVLEDRLEQITASYAQIYARHKGILQNLRALHLPIPEEFAVPARHILSHRLLREIERLRNVTKESAYRQCVDIVQTASYLGLKLNVRKASHIFQEMIESRLTSLRKSLDATICEDLLHFTQMGERLKLDLNEMTTQNLLYFILQEQVIPLIDKLVASGLDGSDEAQYGLLDMVLRLAYRFNFNIKMYKDRLKPVEQAMSQDPKYWP